MQKSLTPKGKKVAIGLGVALAVIVGLVLLPSLKKRIGNTPPEPFVETPHTEFVDFLSKLPYENDHFRIYFDDYYNELVIVPLIEIDGEKNPLEEYARIWPTYEQYANEAVAWMKAEKADFDSFTIAFDGEDFWPNGKRINY